MATKPTLSDSLTALKMALGKIEKDFKYDVNGDGVIDTTDVLGLQKAYLGKDPGFAFVGDAFSSPAGKTPEEYAAIEKANQERIAAEQKETERRQALLADAQKIYGNVTADLVANNPNLSAQELASLATRNYWANESEAFARVSEGMKNGTAQIKQVIDGYDESNQPITRLAITTGEHPGYDTLYLNETPQKGVYQFSTPNQVAGGMIHGVIQADPEKGTYTPIQDFTKQIKYTPGESGSFFGNLVGDLGDMYKSLGPIGGIIGNAIAPGLGSALSAITAIDEGNTAGGVLGALGAAGAYGGAALQAGDTSGLGGVLAENLPEIKTATSAAQLANAVQSGNLGGALTAAGNLTGVSADPAVKTAIQTVGLVQALDSGNTAQALTLVGQLTDNPDAKVASDAIKLVNAINSGNPLAIQGAVSTLAKTTGANEIAGPVDQKIIDSVLDSPATKTTADVGSILGSDEVKAGTQQLIDAITNPQNTASYTGTQVADAGGTTGLPSDKVTDKDLEQLGVGLPTDTGTNQLTTEDLAKIVSGGIGDATLTGGTGEDSVKATGQDTITGAQDIGKTNVADQETKTEAKTSDVNTGVVINHDPDTGVATVIDNKGEVKDVKVDTAVETGTVINLPDNKEEKKETTIVADDGSTITLDSKGNVTNVTDATDVAKTNVLDTVLGNQDTIPSAQDTISTKTDTITGGADTLVGGQDTVVGKGEDTIKGSQDTGKTFVADDGSTLTINSDGTVSSTEATVDGGTGTDTLLGGTGTDTLLGGTETDTSVGGDGEDSIDGGESTVDGGTGTDTLLGGTGTDTTDGGTGTNTLVGGEGEDSIEGGESTTKGVTGNDTITGGDGTDVISDDGTTDDIQKVIDDLISTDTGTGTTIVNDDGSTITLNEDGTVTSTEATDTDTEANGKTIVYDDGSTLTLNADGTVSSTDSTDDEFDLYDLIGIDKSSLKDDAPLDQDEIDKIINGELFDTTQTDKDKTVVPDIRLPVTKDTVAPPVVKQPAETGTRLSASDMSALFRLLYPEQEVQQPQEEEVSPYAKIKSEGEMDPEVAAFFESLGINPQEVAKSMPEQKAVGAPPEPAAKPLEKKEYESLIPTVYSPSEQISPFASQGRQDFANDQELQKILYGPQESSLSMAQPMDTKEMSPEDILKSDFGLLSGMPMSWQLQEKLRKLFPNR